MIIITADSGSPEKGHVLPSLPYDYGANEPVIDAETMEIHYGKHHAGYVKKLNEALSKHEELRAKPLVELLSDIRSVPKDILGAVRDNGGGHLNHSMFWPILGGKGGEPSGDLAKKIESDLGGLDQMKDRVIGAGKRLFGSGWIWLVLDDPGALLVIGTKDQDSPVMAGYKPVMGIDVWEHAYYLKYRNDREAYLTAIWDVINWRQVEENLQAAS